ncbi:MAG TPA: SxtJ family membrane protein [Elusimicrobiales bacterium]|nr:SxtJ family membrane protein [Elusimicrobiales bacterium]
MNDADRKRELGTVCLLAAAAAASGFFFKIAGLQWLALVLLSVGLAWKSAAARISRAWLAFAGVLGRMNSRLLLSLIFFLVITPAAFLFRLFNKDHLRLRKCPGAPSYFRDRARLFSKEDLKNPW